MSIFFKRQKKFVLEQITVFALQGKPDLAALCLEKVKFKLGQCQATFRKWSSRRKARICS